MKKILFAIFMLVGTTAYAQKEQKFSVQLTKSQWYDVITVIDSIRSTMFPYAHKPYAQEIDSTLLVLETTIIKQIDPQIQIYNNREAAEKAANKTKQ